jgi:hypothetical protein
MYRKCFNEAMRSVGVIFCAEIPNNPPRLDWGDAHPTILDLVACPKKVHSK